MILSAPEAIWYDTDDKHKRRYRYRLVFECYSPLANEVIGYKAHVEERLDHVRVDEKGRAWAPIQLWVPVAEKAYSFPRYGREGLMIQALLSGTLDREVTRSFCSILFYETEIKATVPGDPLTSPIGESLISKYLPRLYRSYMYETFKAREDLVREIQDS